MNWKSPIQIAAACLAVSFAARGQTGVHPYPLYPSEPVPGWPGVGADETTTREKLEEAGGGSATYGQPEFLAYPGAIHHERADLQRYVPPYPFYNQHTLVKNFVLNQMTGFKDRCVAWAEPVYYTPMYQPDQIATKQKRPAVRAYPWTPQSPVIRLELGRLPRSLYVARTIAAAPEVTDGSWQARQYAFIQFRVNDDPQDPRKMRPYLLRAPTVDNFYAIQEFFFHAYGDRDVVCEFSLHPQTRTKVLLYNVDVHDRYGELARKRGKVRTDFTDVAARHEFWEANRQADKVTGFPSPTPSERQKLDDHIWNETWPALNSQFLSGGRYYYHPVLQADPARYWRGYLCLAPSEWADDPSPSIRMLKPQRITKTHVYLSSRNEIHQEPPSYEFKGGEYDVLVSNQWQRLGAVADCEIKEGKLVSHGRELLDLGKARLQIRHIERFKNGQPDGELAGYPVNGIDRLGWKFFDPGAEDSLTGECDVEPGVYYYANRPGGPCPTEKGRWQTLGDPNTGWDDAMRLVRAAYDWPAFQPTRDIGLLQGTRGLNRRILRRYQWDMQESLVRVYDSLFEFINGNEDLARAVGRYLPWIKNSNDLVAFLDTTVIQEYANEMLKFRHWYDHQNHALMLQAVVAQDDVEITRPWMEHLWLRFFEYPQAIAGLPESLISSTGRDGGTTIGSYFYTAGSPVIGVAELLETYIRNGGDKKYDLTDPWQYPMSRSAVYLPFEAQAAGRANPGVGDVGGPTQAYGRVLPGRGVLAAGWRWTHDPKFAWELVNTYRRANEGDADWAAIVAAARQCPRDPYLMNRSRVLSDWNGYLTAGQESDDFRFKREVAVRVGAGEGHAHNDTLDLRLWAHGVTMSGDMGQRPGYGQPPHASTRVHNLVEVDGKNWLSHSWVRNLFDAPGAPYLMAESVPPYGLEYVTLFRRQDALIEVDPGKPSAQKPPQTDPDVVTPSSYVFDVFRVAGGSNILTYCYHGVADDQFSVNVKNRKDMTGSDTNDLDEIYLKGFGWRSRVKNPDPDDVEWAADPAADTLVATWRLARGGDGLPEKRMTSCPTHPPLGGALTAPRKFNRLYLFDAAGDRILHGICRDNTLPMEHNPLKPGYAGRCLFAQKRAADGRSLENVFAAILEPYAGTPFIQSARSLPVENNETDARKAVAIEVKTVNGHTDLCFADGRPERIREFQISNFKSQIAAEFAYLSTDQEGLRQATISGGRRIESPDITLEVRDAQYGGKITAVDYLHRTVTLDGPVPGQRFAGAFIEAGGEFHKSTHEISAVEHPGGKTVLYIRKGLEVMRSMVTSIDPATGVLKTRVAMMRVRGADRDLTASNEDTTKFWKIASTGNGNRHDGWEFQLTGAHLPITGVSPGQILRVWEFGVGDRVTVRTGVSLRRVDPRIYEVLATSPFAVRLAGKSLAVSRDRQTWKAVPSNTSGGQTRAEFGEEIIDDGIFYLQVAP